MKTQTSSKSMKLMVRPADYEYLSTIAVRDGISIPAALSQVLRGVKENGLAIVLIPKPVVEKAAPPVKLVKGKVVRSDAEKAAMAACIEYYQAGMLSTGVEDVLARIDATEDEDEKYAIAVAWYEKNGEAAISAPVGQHPRQYEYIATLAASEVADFLSEPAQYQFDAVERWALYQDPDIDFED